MSRGLLYGLIAAAALANVAVFLWQDMVPETVVPLTKQRLPRLVLISELASDSRDLPGQADTAEDTGNVIAEAVAGDAPSAEAESVAGQVAAASVGREDGGSGGEGLAPASDATDRRPVDVTANAVDVAGGLGERAESDTTAAPGLQRCWLAGPVVGERLAVELAARFDAAGLTMDLVLETVEAEPEYWVYLPTSGAPPDMRRLSRELREAGIETFPINEGTLAGSLSIGLFRSQKRAESMQGRLQEQGYPAEIYPRSRVRDEAWILLDDPGRTALGWPDREGALPGYAGMILKERACPESDD